MYKKRIAGLVAGTALAASAVIIPTVNAQIPVDGGHIYEVVTQQDGGKNYIFIPTGKRGLVPTDLAANGGPGGPHNSCVAHNSLDDNVVYNLGGSRTATATVEGEEVTY